METYKKATDSRLAPLLQGIKAYTLNDLDKVLPRLHSLQQQQNPQAVFLTCSDSRILPTLITNKGIGDIFTIRNIGNFAPIHTTDKSVEAAIIYAISTLQIPAIIVCGHSNCGAMNSLLAQSNSSSLANPQQAAITTWLAHGKATIAAYQQHHPLREIATKQGFDVVDTLAIINVALQLAAIDNLDLIAETNTATLGMFFDIATGKIAIISEQAIELIS